MAENQRDEDLSFRRKQVRNLLKADDAKGMGGSMGKLVFGIIWCVVAGLVFATAFTVLGYAWFGGSGIGWFGWLLVYIVVMAGLLAYLNFKPKVARVEVPATRSPGGDSAIEAQLGQIKAQANQYLSKLTSGPGAVVEGLRGVRGKWTYEQEATFDRAATLVLDLAQFDGGVKVREVMHPPEDMKVFGLAVDLLEALDWMGKATKGTSVWLSSVGRKKLVERKLIGSGTPELR